MTAIAALLVFGGIVAVALGVAERAKARRAVLERILETELAEPSRSPEALADLVERAGHVAERAFAGTSVVAQFRTVLTRAGWALRPGEFVAVLAAEAAGATVLAGLVAGRMAGVVAGLAVPVGHVIWVTARGTRRVRRIEAQLPTMLQVMASSLESGASVLHAMELAAEDGDPPLSDEFARVVAETRVGRPLLEALEAMSDRTGSTDLTWTVEAIRIQHTSGGKLADVLRVLADFMRSRLEVRGEVQALSAEARLSAKILTGLPLALAGYLFLFRRGYLAPLYETSMGRVMIAFAVIGIVLGSVWMRRIAKVEV